MNKLRLKQVIRPVSFMGLSIPKNSIIAFSQENKDAFIYVFSSFPRNYKGDCPFLTFSVWNGATWETCTERSELTKRVFKAWSAIDRPHVQRDKKPENIHALMMRGEKHSGRDGYVETHKKSSGVKPQDGHVVTEIIHGKEFTTTNYGNPDSQVTFHECYWEKGTNRPQVAYKKAGTPIKAEKNKKRDDTHVASHTYSGGRITKFNPDAVRIPANKDRI